LHRKPSPTQARQLQAVVSGRSQQDACGEDEEHQRPSYLVEPDPDSMFGTDEMTAPPVIGG
jgi:hypothetical protein